MTKTIEDRWKEICETTLKDMPPTQRAQFEPAFYAGVREAWEFVMQRGTNSESLLDRLAELDVQYREWATKYITLAMAGGQNDSVN